MDGLKSGFSLIELLFVVAIVGILSAIAYPIYTKHVQTVRTKDGTVALMLDQILLEQCFAENQAYDAKCKSKPSFPHVSKQGFYTLYLTHIEKNHYRLTAITANGKQLEATEKTT